VPDVGDGLVTKRDDVVRRFYRFALFFAFLAHIFFLLGPGLEERFIKQVIHGHDSTALVAPAATKIDDALLHIDLIPR